MPITIADVTGLSEDLASLRNRHHRAERRIAAVERHVADLSLPEAPDTDTPQPPEAEGEIDLDALFAPLLAQPRANGAERLDIKVFELYDFIWDQRFEIFTDDSEFLNWFEWQSMEEEADPNAETHPYYAGGALFHVWRQLYDILLPATPTDHDLLYPFLEKMEEAAKVDVFRMRVARNFHRVRFARSFDSGRPTIFQTEHQNLGVLLRELRKQGLLERWEGKTASRNIPLDQVEGVLSREAVFEPASVLVDPVPPAADPSAADLEQAIDTLLNVASSPMPDPAKVTLCDAVEMLNARLDKAHGATRRTIRVALRALQGEADGT